MEGKKISFGFMKTKKAEKPAIEENKEFIECMDDNSLKIIGGETKKEAVPLVIPMKPNTLITTERLKQIADEVESALKEPESEEIKPNPVQDVPENETLDQMAIRELLQDANKKLNVETTALTVPIPSKTVVEGQKESTLEDYEEVPIQDFGMAMLRGMGWAPSKEQTKYKHPQLRPKGLGLGADKVVTESQKKKAKNEKGEELSIIKNSFVRICSGKYSGYYGKVVSLDEENGRVMVDITVKKETVSLSEFMMQPVTKSEYDKESKVINADSYDAYKNNEKQSQNSSKNDAIKFQAKEPSSSKKNQDSGKNDHKDRRAAEERESRRVEKRSDEKYSSKYRRNSSSSDEKRKLKKEKKRYSSQESLSSLSDTERKRKHKSRKKRYSSSDSDSDSPRREKRKRTPVKKRDIDKKRKGKKKKRDRDRSPNYKKHRK